MTISFEPSIRPSSPSPLQPWITHSPFTAEDGDASLTSHSLQERQRGDL
ncbi:hypothetical protein SynPROS91_01280 [Synechococcus sp. PROS-9-1]|nr:hypothetical protein SynPROS91_01280 [Synechococcus sp. PROS-9-1]